MAKRPKVPATKGPEQKDAAAAEGPAEFAISRELAEAVVNYLAQRPWIEVQQLLPAVQAGLRPIE